MGSVFLILIVVIAILSCGLLLLGMYWFGYLGDGGEGVHSVDRLRKLVYKYREEHVAQTRVDGSVLVQETFAEQDTGRQERPSALRLNIARKLYYARWGITPVLFHLMRCAVMVFLVASVFAVLPNSMHVGMALNVALLGFSVMTGLLDLAVKKRSNSFDRDYPVMLMSFSSLLKTGMNPSQALEKVALSLPGQSLVRQEIEIMSERMRLGLSEEEAVCAFAADVFHPEIELFIQALVLNMKVGGRLSSVMERLTLQVRKRRELKENAVSAVGTERGSIWAIILIMTVVMFFMWRLEPDMVAPLFLKPMGQTIFSWSLLIINIGVVWSRKVTNVMV